METNWKNIKKELPEINVKVNDIRVLSLKVIGWKSGSSPCTGYFQKYIRDFINHKKGEIEFVGDRGFPINNISHWTELPLNPVICKQI